MQSSQGNLSTNEHISFLWTYMKAYISMPEQLFLSQQLKNTEILSKFARK